MSVAAARRRVRANQKVLEQRAMDAMASRQNMQAQARRLPVMPILIAAGGAVTALFVLRRPAKALSGIAALLLRVLNTPLGPMAIGAVMSRRSRGAGLEQAPASRQQH